jgi:hypothetical protein
MRKILHHCSVTREFKVEIQIVRQNRASTLPGCHRNRRVNEAQGWKDGLLGGLSARDGCLLHFSDRRSEELSGELSLRSVQIRQVTDLGKHVSDGIKPLKRRDDLQQQIVVWPGILSCALELIDPIPIYPTHDEQHKQVGINQ